VGAVAEAAFLVAPSPAVVRSAVPGVVAAEQVNRAD
jgi:hypothetical protein